MDFQVTRLRCLVKKQLAIAWLISLATFAAVDPTLNSLQRAKGAFEGQQFWLYLFLASASHGVLDAFTNGGLGVAFFSPFDATRYFFPCHPIEVSPIGAAFFSERGLSVLQSEFVWVWLPSIVFAILAFAIRRLFESSPGLSDRSSNR